MVLYLYCVWNKMFEQKNCSNELFYQTPLPPLDHPNWYEDGQINGMLTVCTMLFFKRFPWREIHSSESQTTWFTITARSWHSARCSMANSGVHLDHCWEQWQPSSLARARCRSQCSLITQMLSSWTARCSCRCNMQRSHPRRMISSSNVVSYSLTAARAYMAGSLTGRPLPGSASRCARGLCLLLEASIKELLLLHVHCKRSKWD